MECLKYIMVTSLFCNILACPNSSWSINENTSMITMRTRSWSIWYVNKYPFHMSRLFSILHEQFCEIFALHLI